MSTLTPWSPLSDSLAGSEAQVTLQTQRELIRELNRRLSKREPIWRESIAFPVRSISANSAAKGNDFLLLVTTGGGGVTVTLPPARQSKGIVFVIKKVDAGAGNLTVALALGTDSIDGAATKVTAVQYTTFRLQADGASLWALI